MQLLRIARGPNALAAGMIACLLVLPGTRVLGDDDERARWLSDHWKVVEDAKVARDENSIITLGDIVRPLGRRPSEMSSETRELFDEARKTLLSIPGHATYFDDKIKALTDAEIARTSTAHSSQRGWYFETLSQLQSPETVRVLGEFLFDERNPSEGIDYGDSGGPYANSLHAVDAIYDLGINNPPVRGPFSRTREDLHTWQLWYQQVRAGTRTFSFKGDDKVYTLAGQVTEAKEPGSSTTRPSPSSVPQTLAESPRRLRWPLIVAAVAAVAALFVVIKKVRRPSPMP